MSELADDVEAQAPELTLRQRRRDALLQDALVFCTVFSAGALAYAVVSLVVDETETFWSVSLSDGLILSGLVLGELFLLWNNGVRQGVRGHSIGKHRVGIQVVDVGSGQPVGWLRGFWRGLVVVGLLDLALAVIPVGLPTVLRRLTPEAWHVGAFAYIAVLVLLVPLLLPTDRGLADRLSGTTVVLSADTTTPAHRSALLAVDVLGVAGVLAVFVLYLSFLWPLIGQMPSLW
ncbi:RDD family protein [Aeromicrobium sp. Leaf350]|uniref:RDD family protein n=1 Tax=Aeromicrobium sp. Leaf350 TaxID=2876565 RepID=UPI001E62410A|nr:RDD family protein [Aeromicrobium sp. Leaf350]